MSRQCNDTLHKSPEENIREVDIIRALYVVAAVLSAGANVNQATRVSWQLELLGQAVNADWRELDIGGHGGRSRDL